MFGFEKLDVWQVAIEFADEIYRTTQRFPSDERFGLTSQLRRSAVSIAANVAEGAGRNSKPEFIRFLAVSYGSLMEVVSHLQIAQRQKFLLDTEHQRLYEYADRLARLLSRLRSSLEQQ